MAMLPPVTSALVPILAGLETFLAPILGAYLPALAYIKQVLGYIIPLILGVHAIDSLRFAMIWFSGKAFASFQPFSAMLPPLFFTMPKHIGTMEDPAFKNIFNPGFTNTLSFASNILNSIEQSAKTYG